MGRDEEEENGKSSKYFTIQRKRDPGFDCQKEADCNNNHQGIS